MSNDDPSIISKEGYLQVKLHSQPKWHRRYCIIDWDKSILFVASKNDRQYGDWIKLLPNIHIIESELPADFTIEIKADNESHFLQTETKKEYTCWLIALKRTAFSRFGGGIFGQSLEDTQRYSLDKTASVPIIVRQCCEFLLEYGPTFVGLFRIPGKQSLIRELRDKYDRGETIELNNSHSPATISSLLKIYLQSLPDPIIPLKNFDEFLEIGSRFKYNQTNDLDCLKQLIETTLSHVNYALLAYLCLFLKKLTEYAQETKMDTENLAIAFGSNLIRTSEELDINMIKGHNFNLFPLIKVLIDYSEYLFPVGFSMNLNESCEQHNESITKSSGFSSFSSLLSSNDHQVVTRTRSSSLPSIPYAVSSSIDSTHLSYNEQSDHHDVQFRSNSVIEKPICHTSYQCGQKELSIDEENDEQETSNVEKRVPRVDMSKDEEINDTQLVTKEHKRKSSIPFPFGSKSHGLLPTRRPSTKTLANKFGKSLSSFKTSMSKAFNPHLSSTENILQSNTIDVSSFRSPQQHDGRRSLDSNLLTDYLKTLQNEICVLKGIIDKKENEILHLTKTSDDERMKYEKENCQLKQQIEQLQVENTQLKAFYQPDN